MNIQVDYFTFIATGEFGIFKVGTLWETVPSTLGEPQLYEPPHPGTAALARYGDLEFTILGEEVITISLQVDHSNVELPDNIIMMNFENAQMKIIEVKNILKSHSVTWERVELLCDDWIDYYRTSAGVHLSFGNNLLGKVGVSNFNISGVSDR